MTDHPHGHGPDEVPHTHPDPGVDPHTPLPGGPGGDLPTAFLSLVEDRAATPVADWIRALVATAAAASSGSPTPARPRCGRPTGATPTWMPGCSSGSAPTTSRRRGESSPR